MYLKIEFPIAFRPDIEPKNRTSFSTDVLFSYSHENGIGLYMYRYAKLKT